ncbi:MAG: hypothetical protein HKL80_11160 [Acidimicrobiales bacterium]|nr:hypothetical protein [Acidimicrobiales bacterium]
MVGELDDVNFQEMHRSNLSSEKFQNLLETAVFKVVEAHMDRYGLTNLRHQHPEITKPTT